MLAMASAGAGKVVAWDAGLAQAHLECPQPTQPHPHNQVCSATRELMASRRWRGVIEHLLNLLKEHAFLTLPGTRTIRKTIKYTSLGTDVENAHHLARAGVEQLAQAPVHSMKGLVRDRLAGAISGLCPQSMKDEHASARVVVVLTLLGVIDDGPVVARAPPTSANPKSFRGRRTRRFGGAVRSQKSAMPQPLPQPQKTPRRRIVRMPLHKLVPRPQTSPSFVGKNLDDLDDTRDLHAGMLIVDSKALRMADELESTPRPSTRPRSLPKTSPSSHRCQLPRNSPPQYTSKRGSRQIKERRAPSKVPSKWDDQTDRENKKRLPKHLKTRQKSQRRAENWCEHTTLQDDLASASGKNRSVSVY